MGSESCRAALLSEVSPTFKSLQGLTTHVAQQREYLIKLLESLLCDVGGRGPIMQSELYLVYEQSYVISGELSVSHESILEFISSIGYFVSNRLDELEERAIHGLVLHIGHI